MRERLATLLCAIGALMLFILMFVRGEPAQRTRTAARPSTAEQSTNGYAAAHAWLNAAGIETRSLREPWSALEQDGSLAPRGNLLIVTLPGTRRIGTAELVSLRRWIASGNTLLVAAAMSDAPDWAYSVGGLGRGDPQVLTGIEFESIRSRDARRQPAPGGRLRTARISEAIPDAAHPYFEGVRSMEAVSDYAPQPHEVRIPFDGFMVQLAHLRATGEGVFWMRTRGEGRVLVSALGTLWTQRALGRADNARLLGNIVAASTAPGGAVIFDDHHQGVAPGYDPSAFYSDPRFSATVLIVIALWLVWVIGGTRLRARAVLGSGPDEAYLLERGGVLFARTIRTPAAALRLIELTSARLRQRGALRAGESLHEFLARQPRVSPSDAEALRDWSARAEAGRRVPLSKLYNLLLGVEKFL